MNFRKLGFSAFIVQCLLTCSSARAQEQGETPGAIANPGSYQGSMQLQREEQQQYQQQEQQNQQMQQRLNQNYQQYAPRSGAGGQNSGARLVDWWSKPALPPERNPLLGRWKQVKSKGISSGQAAGPLGGLVPGAGDFIAGFVNSSMAGGCKSMFGSGVIAFEPTALSWLAPDGHEEILNRVAYRANGDDIVVITKDPGAVPQIFFGFPNHDHAVVALFNCTMDRLGAKGPAVSGSPGTDRSPRQLVQATAAKAVMSGVANAWLELKVGTSTPGQFTPIAGIQIWMTPEDPQIAMAQVAGASTGSLSERLAADCRDPLTCRRDWKVMSAKAVNEILTDATGHAKTPMIATGRYYLVGHAGYENGWLFWHQAVDLRPGSNELILDQTKASLMK